MNRLISYAQNFEDVLLWRALAHVQRGTYLDVGAQDPDVDSVSRLFHERGWRGVHAEPMPEYAEALRAKRPSDTVVQAAVGTGGGTIEFYGIAGTGLSTSRAAIAEQHRKNGFETHPMRVPVASLDELFALAPQGDVHWLKIDVEGSEADVLSSWTQDRYRPWVVVVESTEPLGQAASHLAWEPALLERGYTFAMFDGLNRFYVSHGHPELLPAFATGANVFDGFALSGQASAPFCDEVNRRNAQLRSELQDLRDRLARLQKAKRDADAELATHARAAQSWRANAQALRVELDAVYASSSWRVTAPLRGLRQGLSVQGARRAVVAPIRRMIVRLMKFALGRPTIKRSVMRMLATNPALLNRVQRFAVRAGLASSMGAFEASRGRPLPTHIANGVLSIKASRVLYDLERVMKEKQN